MDKKILIVEDEVLIALDLKSFLEDFGYNVVGILHNSDEVHDAIRNKRPDMILLDINILGTRNGIEVAHMINKEFSLPFVFITSYSDSDTIKNVQETSPAGYIVKPFDENDLRVELDMAFYRASQKRNIVFPSIDKLNRKLQNPLTQREYQIIEAIQDSKNNMDISNELFLSVNTIKTHIKNIYSKCSVNSRVDLIKFCHTCL